MAYRRTERVEARLEERRKAMLDAARALFLAHGYDGTSMQAVARRAGTSIGNLYFYFRDKDALLEAVLEEVLHDITARADALCARLPKGPAWIAGATYAGTLAVLERRELCARVLADAHASKLRKKALARFVSRFEARLARHPELARGADPKLVALATQGAMFHTLETLLGKKRMPQPKSVAAFLSRFVLSALGCAAREIDAAMAQVEAAAKQRSPRRAGARSD